ncbi:N-alpha-acetyltransferase 15, NatA auxiliary subunit isoform X1 [Canna indica]|uniref:N-alpha-acetyltransferase 15, NatA auxiliary subunit isoform X1 n=1 Tax=Canna indica TaxID=4628 RepID=A0AAQ3KU72_9LILI|nr:N-alpha-acetyltransferase 15, NatA auxiliary subunit isoform X1 [Canna indica]
MRKPSLPPEEADMFEVVVKSYKTKQYKKGLKAADTILEKFPEHGETLSMKGLTLNCMNQKSEAYELVHRGLKNDLKSHVCWYAYGLVYQSDREYREAMKCYRSALKIDPDNIDILWDLSLLQVQLRDLTDHVETRQHLLELKPKQRINWIGLAVAHQLNSNASKAINILEAYEGILEDNYPRDSERYEHGEILLYKISLLMECGSVSKAMEEMVTKESEMVDKLAFREQLASILLKLGFFKEAETIYRTLLIWNADNYKYFIGLQKCLGLYSENGEYTSNQIVRLDALYQSLRYQYNQSSVVKRIPLDFLEGDKFREAADNYVRPFLTEGVASLFSDLSPLYDHSGKTTILEKLYFDIEHSIRRTGCFPGSLIKEPTSTFVWTMSLLSQHYDRRGQHHFALALIDEAIEHTPTMIDLYSIKGRILEHLGDLPAAAALASTARSMDPSDPYLNSACVRKMLHADQVELAEKIAVLFPRGGDELNDLHNLHNMWYELDCGESYFRQGDLGRALKNFLAVEKHYSDMVEDQFDFHYYCLRKMNLRAYVSMLKFQDELHSHETFHKAAAGVIRCYIKLHDCRSKLTTEEGDEMLELPYSWRKKIKQKQKKVEVSTKKEAEGQHGEEKTSGLSKSSEQQSSGPVDQDPQGEKLLQVEDPLLEATKYLRLLQLNPTNSLETYILSFEVNMRKQKILLAFQALKQLIKLNDNDPDCHRCLIKFFYKISSFTSPMTDSEELIYKVLKAEGPYTSQLNVDLLVGLCEYFLQENEDSLMHRAAVAEMLYFVEPEKKVDAIKLIEYSKNKVTMEIKRLGPFSLWKLQECIAVHKLLETVFNDQDAASRWQARCAKYFPYSTYFRGCRSSVVLNSFVQITVAVKDSSQDAKLEDSRSLNTKDSGRFIER